MRILVVEDEPRIAADVTSALTGAGYVVTTGAVAPGHEPILYAIANNGPLNLYAGYARDKKWLTVSTGIGARTAGPADVSVVTGRVLTGLDRDEEDSVLFVVGIGSTESEAVAAMQELAAGDPTGVVTDERTAAAMLGALAPNPATLVARVAIDLRAGGSLALYDALGRLVADLTDRLPAGGAGMVTIDAAGLAPGVYVLRASDGRGSVSRRLVVR